MHEIRTHESRVLGIRNEAGCECSEATVDFPSQACADHDCAVYVILLVLTECITNFGFKSTGVELKVQQPIHAASHDLPDGT